MRRHNLDAPSSPRTPAAIAASASAPSPIAEKKVATFLKSLKDKTLRGLFPSPQDRLKPIPFPFAAPEQREIQAGQKITDGLWIARSERGKRPATVMWPYVEGFGKQWQAEDFHCVVHIVHPSDAIKIYKDRTKEDMLSAKKWISDVQEALFLRIVPYYGNDVQKQCQLDYSQLLVMRDWVHEAPRWDGAQGGADQPAAPVLIVAESAYDSSVISLAVLLAAQEGESAQETHSRLASMDLKPQWKDALGRLTSADFELLNRILTEG